MRTWFPRQAAVRGHFSRKEAAARFATLLYTKECSTAHTPTVLARHSRHACRLPLPQPDLLTHLSPRGDQGGGVPDVSALRDGLQLPPASPRPSPAITQGG